MEEQVGAGMGIFVFLLILAVFGAIVGWIASMLIKGTGLGLAGDIVLGIVGSVLGGWPVLLPAYRQGHVLRQAAARADHLHQGSPRR